MDFPTTRMRRYRKNAKIREVMRETKLNIEDLIYPLYAAEDIKDGEPQEIKTMPGQFRYSINDCVEYAKELESKGLKMVIVFGIPSPEKKDEIASPKDCFIPCRGWCGYSGSFRHDGWQN